MATAGTRLLTAEEFAALPDPPDGSQQELVRGEVVTMSPSPQARHGYYCCRVGRLIGNYADDRKLGWVVTNDTGVILERDPDTVRGPDVAFYSLRRQPVIPEGYFEIPPDLAVEVLSPSDRSKAVRAKIKQYVDAGVPLVWLVDPETQIVTVFRKTTRGVEFEGGDLLDGGDVLPGFACKVADLFG